MWRFPRRHGVMDDPHGELGIPQKIEKPQTHLDAHAVEKDIGLGFLKTHTKKQLRVTLVIYG